MRRLAMVVASVALAACSTPSRPSYDEDTLLRCDDWGTNAPTMDHIYAGCMEPDNVYEKASHERCDDGRTLYWTRVNWGWLGERAQGRHEPSEDAPAAAIATCERA